MRISETLLPEFDHEMATTRRLLERVPEDKFGWKPHDKSMTMGRLAAHLAHLPDWSGVILQTAELDFSAGGAPQEPKPETTQELLQLFDQAVAKARQDLAGTEDEVLRENWTLRNGDHVIFTLPKAGVMRSFVLSHSIHHRGQLSVYLRLNDVPLPSIYGPSADEGI